MKTLTTLLACLLLVQAKATKDQAPVLETKYFSFYNNINLNTHLYLYKKALRCKLKKTPADSIAITGSEGADMPLTEEDLELVKKTIVYYRDSIVSKDLLFDREMAGFSDMLVKEDPSKEKMNDWQKRTWEKVKAFQVLYLKIYSRQFNRKCANWIMHCKKDIMAMEDSVVAQLQKIFGDTLPEGKIRVDLTHYATWAGAYSYNYNYNHIVLDAGHRNNQKEAGVEVLFHETGHFLVDNMGKELEEIMKLKNMNEKFNPWHNLIFYTTAVVVKKLYEKQQRPFTPYYIQQDFEGRIPGFKKSIEAFKLYWDPYTEGKTDRRQALEKILEHLLAHRDH